MQNNIRNKIEFVIFAVFVAAWAAQAGDNKCSLAPQHAGVHQHPSKASGVGMACVTQCMLDQLGQPRTESERLLIYLTAVSEYCAALSSDLALCNSEPLCQVIIFAGNATVHAVSEPGQATAHDWLQALTKHARQECWPDWLRILNQECSGSKQAQVKRCLKLTLAEDNAMDYYEMFESYVALSRSCPQGCMLVNSHYKRACLPPWMLHEFCSGRSCMIAADKSVDGAAQASHCIFEEAFLDSGHGNVENTTCSFAIAYARSTSWSDFQGSCPHRAAVARLLRAVPDAFIGNGGCSIEEWVTINPEIAVARARLCGMLPLVEFPRHVLGDSWWEPESLAQVALFQCASGYMHMHAALSALWRSPALYSRLLEGSGSWSQALPHAEQVCRALCVGHRTEASASGAHSFKNSSKDPRNVLEGVLTSYCSSALALKEAAAADLPLADTSQFGCADAQRRLKDNWFQHQLLASLWLVLVASLVLIIVACCLLQHASSQHLPCCGASPDMPGACNGWDNFSKRMSPSYHGSGLALDYNRSTWGCVVHRVLSIVRACWYLVDISLSVTMMSLLSELQFTRSGLPTAVAHAVGWWVWWWLIMVCAPVVVTMLLVVPVVLSAYGFLDFARMHFSMGCCVLLFFSFAWVVFLVVVFGMGAWFITIADLYMLAALFGVPHHKLLGNKLNVNAYTSLRFMCQGVVQALPSALVSTAVIDTLLVVDTRSPDRFLITQFLWASLLLSMSRFAWEVISLAVLMHRLRAHCFVTAIVDVVHHLQPEQSSHPREVPAAPGRPLSKVSARGHDGHKAQAELASLNRGQAPADREGPGMLYQVAQGSQAVWMDRQAAPKEIQELSAVRVEQPPGENVAACQAGAVPAQAAVQLHSSSSAVEGASCCSSCGGRACWPQQYPKFIVVYVWVVSLLVGAFACVVCSHIIWPWLFFNESTYYYYNRLPAASLWPYSLLGLWGNWKLSGSVKGSLAALGSCDLQQITCNFTAV